MALLSGPGCGRKGDPIPRPRAMPEACEVAWTSLRMLEIRLPRKDIHGVDLVGLERVRLVYLPLGNALPTSAEVLARGEVVQERRRPDLPGPGGTLRMDLKELSRPSGWLVVVSVRVGNVVGKPSLPLAWLDPRI